MSAIFFLEKEAAKKRQGGPIDMYVGVFWETFVGFLKSVVFQLFPKYSQSNTNLNVKSRAKFNYL